MFTEKNRWTELAALAHLLVEDRALRQTVIAAQRTRRPAFLPKAILPVLLELVSKLGGAEYVRVGRTEPVRDSPRQQPKFESSSEYASMIWGHR
jgi:hypothetical protein